MEKDNNDTANRLLQSKTIIHASADLVWEVWTNPKHIANWWGPNGFKNTIQKMDFQNEGEWNLTMHGPTEQIIQTEVFLKKLFR